MAKEYRTIQEVAGPLMMVRGVEGVAYDELGEIELESGEKRRCRVLEINGGNALVQLFENSTGINVESSKVRADPWSSAYRRTCSRESSTDWDVRSMTARRFCRMREETSTDCR